MKILFRSKVYNFVRYGVGIRSHCFLIEADGRQYWVPGDACTIA